MGKEQVYSICGMCTVRCPIMTEVENGEVSFIQGNPHASGIEGSICARGAAGLGLLKDKERPQTPLIREGKRGEGKWRSVSWDEALDYVAEKLNKVRDEYGSRSILLSDRGGPFRDYKRAFLRGIGTPNYCNHDASCARNVQHSALSLFGFGRKGVSYDLKNSRHVVLQTRNLFEAINVKEVNDMMTALDKGCKLTVIDVRATVSASKATRYFQIRPGSDYAFNLAVINELLAKELYDKGYVRRWFKDFEALEKFIEPYTPEWAEEETGIQAEELRAFVQELSSAKPAVLWHPGWNTARYKDSFYVCRSIYIINALLGSVGAKGGLPLVNKPGDVGYKGLKSFMDLYPKPEEKRADGVGWKYPQFEEGPGLGHLAFKAMETGDPYPLKAYIAYRHDPLMAYPEPERLQKTFDQLELMVSVTFSWSETAWYSDVVLPLSTYLERESIIATKNALSPYFFLRNRSVEPRFDSKADWEIISGLAKRMGLTELAYDSIEDMWNFQLQDTGVSMQDFKATGMVPLTDGPVYRKPDELKFKTPSGKIEIISEKWEQAGQPSLKPYSPPERPPQGRYRLTFGRCGVHTQGHTVNNPMLFEQMPENVLWIHSTEAEKLGIHSGDVVEVSNGQHSGRIKAMVTDMIHPEAVFMVHGFGHTLPVETRAYGRGVADHKLMSNGLDIWDPAGGAVALQEHFVSVSKV
ncbi:molybdopterin-dependent oxidoreductase [Desulfovermiculus halophilus]|uniref:molybdopterin-dependent oxidoreductase n=1 Tax=Desulfovermiculus halophilus TaxID=339722 RepID=UPI000487824F|nr:molybdopterin-dependent oxidoreductase [Desulfovermiculus halophilus]